MEKRRRILLTGYQPSFSPDLIIGNGGTYFSTLSSVLDTLGISTDAGSQMEIDPDTQDLYLLVTPGEGNYATITGAYASNANISYYEDVTSRITFFGKNSFQNVHAIESVKSPSAIACLEGCFDSCISLKEIYTPSCETLGTDTGDNEVFYLVNVQAIVTLKDTVNQGDGDFVYIDNRATVILAP